MKNKPILGVGAPLLDLLFRADEEFVARYAGEKGGMQMVDFDRQKEILDHAASPIEHVPGGSAGNTVRALARLGAAAGMLGKLGDDADGRRYAEALARNGGGTEYLFRTSEEPTGRCICLVTPDGERTMRPSLGASTKICAEDVRNVDFSKFESVHIEGYALFAEEYFQAVVNGAQSAGCRISLDLASFEVVRAFRDKLPGILEKNIDLVFANEDEADALLPDASPAEQAEKLASWCSVAVVKQGSQGCYVKGGSEPAFHVPARKVRPVDTTAAGDFFQAGFLYGMTLGRPLEDCAKIGALLGSEIVGVIGAELPDRVWNMLRGKIAMQA
ncbi:MAG: adenosine kinase [Victivallaceae bacterium]|nr:adenosine kinase [Victivallaceae bacterium]